MLASYPGALPSSTRFLSAIGDKFIVPAMKEFVETFMIQETNKWGEKIGQKLTFTEYLVKRAEEYAQEMVDSDGRAKGDLRDSYNWRGSTTRISYLINSHLRFHIENEHRSGCSTDSCVRL